MLVEHTFVTTLEPDAAFHAAAAFLVPFGFSQKRGAAGQLVVGRGSIKPHQKCARDLPQKIRLDYDRGRVVVAVTIETPGKAGRVHSNLATALATGLDRCVAQGEPAQQAGQAVHAAEQAAIADYHRRRKRTRILVGILLAFIGFLIFIAVMAAVNA